MSTPTTPAELKDVRLEFHQVEQHAPLTVQPKKQDENNVALINPKFGYKPVEIICPVCHQRGTTNMVHHINECAHLTVFLCSLATWPCGLCFLSGIPYCLTACQKVDHMCPHCTALVGKHSKFRFSKLWNAISRPFRC